MKHDTKYPEPVVISGASHMPDSTLALSTMEWNETGTWRYLRPRYVERIPACQHSCPTSNNIESWIRLFEKGQIEEAWEVATLENPFPSIMGRVCFHPCMDGCNRCEMGGSVNIQMLERALGDAMGKSLPLPKPLTSSSGKRVAVIGAGPAGLACAYHLIRLGHKVSVFDRNPKAGGVLRYGIPSYRLPKDVLGREIDMLEKMGIEFNLGKTIRDAAHLQQMRQDFSALFVATGATRSRAMGIPDEKVFGVMPGLEFLKKVAEGNPPQTGARVLVIGGGNTALDTARTARRLGADTKILYRRTRAEMPAFEEEIRQAEEEGICIEMLLSPKRIVVKNGKACGLVCQRMRLSDPDSTGRRQPVAVEGEEIEFEADSVFTAIGEEIETSIIPSRIHIEHGTIKTMPCGRTEWSNVFAGGDVITQQRTVVDALASGKRSAIAIDCVLRGEAVDTILEEIRVADTDAVLMSRYLQIRTGAKPRASTTSELQQLNLVATFDDLNSTYFTASEPDPYPMRPVEERFSNGGFVEIHMSPSREVCSSELARCCHCGRCTECDNCYIYCPDVAILKKDGGFEVNYYYCKGCGVCPKECPRAAMEMIEEPVEF